MTATTETPIYDQLALEAALGDEEGRGLVAAIHERHRARILRAGVAPAPDRPSRLAVLMMLGGGLFR